MIALSYTIDRLVRLDIAIAVALAYGAFPACRDRVCVFSCGAPCGGVPGGARSDLRRPPQIFHEDNRHRFEVLGWSVNFLSRGFNF